VEHDGDDEDLLAALVLARATFDEHPTDYGDLRNRLRLECGVDDALIGRTMDAIWAANETAILAVLNALPVDDAQLHLERVRGLDVALATVERRMATARATTDLIWQVGRCLTDHAPDVCPDLAESYSAYLRGRWDEEALARSPR
jgi:hypothetical protein